MKDFFTGTATTIEGVGLAEDAQETALRHAAAFGDDPVLARNLEVGGEYAFRMRGEHHSWTPDAVAKLQHAVRGNAKDRYSEFAELMDSDVVRIDQP